MFAPFNSLKGGFVMEINSKKIYLSIILVLFILFSLLFIPCCKVFASDEPVDVYGFSQSRYDNLASQGFIHYYAQPGGKLKIDNNIEPYNATIFYYSHKDDTAFCTKSLYDEDNNIRFVETHEIDYKSGSGFQLNDYYIAAECEFENNYPVLVFFKNGSYNSEESSGITFTYFPPEFGVEVDLTKSSFAPETYGSVVGRVYGTYLPSFGTIEVDLYKENLSTGSSDLIEERLLWISNIDTDFSFNFECPPLEIGSYSLHAKFIVDDEIKYEDTEPFELDGTIKDYTSVIVRDGEGYQVDSAYFNRVFRILNPKHFNLYNEEVWFEINTPLSNDGGYTSKNILGNYVYTDSFALKDILSDLLGNTFNRKVDVYLNNVLIKEYDFKNFSGVTGYLPSALLNRGKNTLFVVSSQGSPEESSEYFNWLAPDGTYRYIHSAIEFFYKTKEGSGGLIVETGDFSGGSSGGGGGSGGGGAFSDEDMPNDGSTGQGYIGFTGLDTPPDRSNYPDDIFGTIGYALDFIFYVISMPFKVLFGALEWLISNFLTLFSWVGQLSSLIGSWFNFLPKEVRSLLLGGFMCSIIAFVLKLFRK